MQNKRSAVKHLTNAEFAYTIVPRSFAVRFLGGKKKLGMT